MSKNDEHYDPTSDSQLQSPPNNLLTQAEILTNDGGLTNHESQLIESSW